jgi:hypothetical protein
MAGMPGAGMPNTIRNNESLLAESGHFRLLHEWEFLSRHCRRGGIVRDGHSSLAFGRGKELLRANRRTTPLPAQPKNKTGAIDCPSLLFRITA